MSSLTSQVLSSSFILLLIRLMQRSIGLISTLILARVLTPEDFGLIAIAALIIHFSEVISDLGSQQYLIQKETISNEDTNSSWTLDIILKFLLWIVLLVAIPAIATFYARPEIENILYVSSIILLVGAFKSPGLALLQRALEYKLIFKLGLAQKLVSFAVVMLFILIEPSYWAIIAGDITSAVFLTLGSYFIHPIRPKLCFSKIREQWSFSQWILLKGGVGYSRAEADTILVSKHFCGEQLGAFHLTKHLATIPNTDILGPAIEPLMAAFSRVKNNADQLSFQFSVSLLVIFLLTLPISVFMWTFPNYIIDFFLGDQWTQAHPILGALSILMFTMVISQFLGQCCIALGRVKALFFNDVLSLVFIFTLLVVFLSNNESIAEFALFRGMLGVIANLILFIYMARVINISKSKCLKLLIPVLFSAIAAAYISQQIPFERFNVSVLNLLFSLIIFVWIYSVFIVLCYLVYFRHTREGQHLFSLARNTPQKLKHILSR